MKKYRILIYSLLCLGIEKTNAQLTDLLNFNGTNGTTPHGSLITSGGVLYGMTPQGGAINFGTIFSIKIDGSGYKNLHSFNDTAGGIPFGSLTLVGKTLYGMTEQGGARNFGCIFSIDTNGNSFRDIFDFSGSDGGLGDGSLILSGSQLFGMTTLGFGFGTIFSIDTDGTGYKALLFFGGNGTPYGSEPEGSLTISGTKLFGMTSSGGGEYSGDGCIFSIDTDGNNYKVLMPFTGTNGNTPYGDLTLLGNKLYGMTAVGGAKDSGCIFSIDTDGTEYKDLHDCNYQGYWPDGSLIISNGKLYGMTSGGGMGNGTIFSIDTNGNDYTDLLNFDGTNGSQPLGNVTLLDGVFYGMTEGGGTNDDGVVFSFNDTASGVNELTAKYGAISVFPNPNNGRFIIQVTSENSNNNIIEVYNVLGVKVFTRILSLRQTDNTVDMTSLPSGVYLYRVKSDNEELVGEGKIIIE
jgi:uncharacterized repeat protein (TIGR03803 family)